MNPPNFLVINCENSKAWDPIDFGMMFEKKFGMPGDVWLQVNVAKGDILPPQELIDSTYAGIIITGSHFNCRDRDSLSWFSSVCDVVRSAAAKGFPRIYGGCFGCQISAFALGSEVDKNPSGRFVLKAETMRPTEHFKNIICECWVGSSCCTTSCECPSSGDDTKESAATTDVDNFLSSPPSDVVVDASFLSLGSDAYQIIVSHGDQVLDLPAGASRLASSQSCENELFICGKNNNILCNQSHPEFDFKYAIQERIWPAVVEKNQRLSPEEVEESLQTFSTFDESDHNRLCVFISHFLRHKL